MKEQSLEDDYELRMMQVNDCDVDQAVGVHLPRKHICKQFS